MQLPKAAYRWAMRHLDREGDSDLFPRPLELNALRFGWSRKVLDDLAGLDLTGYRWRGGKRLLVPKDVLSFRVGTQLDPLDSVVLAALMKKVGPKLERRRVAVEREIVFSYRFSPTDDGLFYGGDTRWHAFWTKSLALAREDACTHVVLGDVADFYNQTYHHVIENQLAAAGLNAAQVGVFKRFLGAYSETVSRGIPVGPHSVHILAELALHPIDEDLLGKGLSFCRYVDDFHIFCRSESEANGALCDLANTLDVQQRFMLSRRKVGILPSGDFAAVAETMLSDRPINEDEEEVLKVVSKHTGSDPYAQISLLELSDEDLEELRQEVLEDLVGVYLSSTPTNYSRLAWLLRRLRQLGAPGAVDYCVDRLPDLAPVAGEVARYLMAAAPNYTGNLADLGARLLAQFDLPVVAKSPYLQIVFLDVLASVPDLNNAPIVTAKYETSPPEVRREILRVAASNSEGSWLRGRKQEFRNMDEWMRRAYLLGISALPGDEAEHWLRSIKRQLSPLERLIAKAALRKPNLNLGAESLV